MRYAILSDVHGNGPALRAVMDDSRARSVDRSVCLGDIVIFHDQPNECVELLREGDVPSILGNHDAIAIEIEEPWFFGAKAMEAVNRTRERLTERNKDWLRALPDTLLLDHFLAVHGSPTNRIAYLFTLEEVKPHFSDLEESGRRICFFGHTHLPGLFTPTHELETPPGIPIALDADTSYFINPGTVGQPRFGDTRPSYGLFDTDRQTYELVRVMVTN